MNDHDLRRCGKISGDQNEKNKTRKDDGIKEGKLLETGTPRTVLFLRGRECNVPLAYPRYFVILNDIVLVSGEELKAKAP